MYVCNTAFHPLVASSRTGRGLFSEECSCNVNFPSRPSADPSFRGPQRTRRPTTDREILGSTPSRGKFFFSSFRSLSLLFPSKTTSSSSAVGACIANAPTRLRATGWCSDAGETRSAAVQVQARRRRNSRRRDIAAGVHSDSPATRVSTKKKIHG